jgi:hypothetical protein
MIAPPIQILVVFLLIVLLRRRPLGHAFVLSSLLLGVMAGQAPKALAATMVHSLVSLRALTITGIVGLVMVLSTSLEAAGVLNGLVRILNHRLRHPLVRIAVFPALIGLLPVPGGALFSAPLVAQIGCFEPAGDPPLFSFTNYWFRHIWECWWPVGPAILMGAALSGLPVWGFAAVLMPVMGVMVAAGFWAIRRRVSIRVETPEPGKPFPSRQLVKAAVAVVMILGSGIGAGAWVSTVDDVSVAAFAREGGLMAALAVAVVCLCWAGCLRTTCCLSFFKQGRMIQLVYLVLSLFAFKGVMESTGLISHFCTDLHQLHVSPMLLCIVLPIVVSLISGLNLVTVGITFPILLPIIAASGTASIVPYAVLAYLCGFAGVMIAPTHLCLVLSNTYFNARPATVYRYLLLPCGLLLIASILYFFLIRIWWP